MITIRCPRILRLSTPKPNYPMPMLGADVRQDVLKICDRVVNGSHPFSLDSPSIRDIVARRLRSVQNGWMRGLEPASDGWSMDFNDDWSNHLMIVPAGYPDHHFGQP